MSTQRIEPLSPPYDDDTRKLFDVLMPPGQKPLNIFRTFARHPKLFKRQMALGGVLLYEGELPHEDREVVLLRTCARCGNEYEWGVHVTAFARPLGFTEDQIRSTAIGSPADDCWDEKHKLLMRVADELHDTNDISSELWQNLTKHWSDKQLIELIIIPGIYTAISWFNNALRIEIEDQAERFPTNQ